MKAHLHMSAVPIGAQEEGRDPRERGHNGHQQLPRRQLAARWLNWGPEREKVVLSHREDFSNTVWSFPEGEGRGNGPV